MADDPLPGLRREYERLHRLLEAPVPDAERADLKQAIVALFKRTEREIAELAEFKETIRDLVERFRELPPPAAQGGGPPPPSRSVRHDHLGASTYLERGWTALAMGQWSEAEQLLREALARDATSSAGQALLGWALLHQDRGDETLQLCLQVLLREPDHGLARTAVGAVCLRKGIVGEAIEHLTRVVRTGTDSRAVLYANYWLGMAYLARDMAADAIEFLRRAVTLGPNLAEGWVGLGQALWWAGQRTEAREAWAVGARIRHSPHATQAAELLRIVESGGTPPRSTLR
jgi:tetratricopeptide (TPR) repeat protein